MNKHGDPSIMSRKEVESMKPKMKLSRLEEIRTWIETHPDDGTAIMQLNWSELSEVNEYRRTMGLGPHTLAQAIDKMIEEKKKEVPV